MQQGQSAGIEIGTAGISSPGDFVESGWPEDVAKQLDDIFAQDLDEVKWTDNLHQGYVRVVVTPTEAKTDFVVVDTVLSTDYKSQIVHSETIERRDDKIGFKS
jgi:phosphodiesterase/alkaline phosphatase D-like protein